ncbi:eukaryotic translation initiation factor 2D isoform X2 [Rhodnius prolixus]|uniref:eukaryotic translation initiation factor 2D isoform X2 n=1 Tax=Rhodnius prolixus TaxID=13249 RepID=UPI003D18DBBA
MFRREFKIKSNCQLKSSDRKRLYATILKSFVQLSDTELQTVLPHKESINQAKIHTTQGESIYVYLCNGLPLILDVNNRIVPTIYFLWYFPNLLHGFKVSYFVIEKLAQGADLMVPGILKNDSGAAPYGQVECNELASIHPLDNKAAIAVGNCLMSSQLMSTHGRGRGVEILHIYGDFICKMVTEKLQIPLISINELSEKVIDSVEELELSEQPGDQIKNTTGEIEQVQESQQELTPDEILMNLFLTALTHSKPTLPILTNLFYKNYMLNNLPSNMEFDIKKTKNKKLSTFLAQMEKDNVIKLQTVQNVQSLIEINSEHEKIKEYRSKFKKVTVADTTVEELPIGRIEVCENYVVNFAVLTFFNKFGLKKNDTLTVQEIRKMVKEYVKSENLQDSTNKELVMLDPVLSKITQSKTKKLNWKTLIEKILSLMGNNYEVRKCDILVSTGRGRIPSVDIVTRLRSSNKKVTIIDNLEIYGVDLQEISRECQHALATSTTLLQVPSKKGIQFQIQGSHVDYIKKLLTDTVL